MSIRDSAGPALRKLLDGLTGGGRAQLNRAVGRGVQSLVRRHLITLAGTRHATAMRLGATPTGHLAQAAEKVSLPESLTADARGAFISISQPGMSRAARDIDINKKDRLLTIPLAAESYGNRIQQGFDVATGRGKSRFQGGFFFTSKNGNLLYARRIPGFTMVTNAKGKEVKRQNIQLLYLLREHVHQPQDRSLLPSDGEIIDAGKAAAGAHIKRLGQAVSQEIASR